MLAAQGRDDRTGRVVLLIGLHAENIVRIEAGEPLYVQQDHPALAGLAIEVVVTTAESLEAHARSIGKPIVEWTRPNG